MKIIQINNHHRIIGGSDTVYFNTGELLASAGHEIGWFAGANPANMPCKDSKFFPASDTLRRERILDFPRYIRNVAAARALEAMVESRGGFDLAHLHIYYGGLTAAILDPLRKRGIPIVQTLHEYKLACPVYTMERDGRTCEECISGSTLNILRHRCKGSLTRSAVALVEYHTSRLQGDVANIDRFICVSEFQRSMLARAGIPKKKMITLHNFVDPLKLQPRTFTERSDYILYFGRIEKLKGMHTLIDAAQSSGIRLLIAGTGIWTETMKERINNLPNVEYLGFMSGEPLRKLVAEARAVVVPSEWYENCPMSVLEAKAVGTPVIGARIGGIPELVRDGEDGFLFEAGDSEDLCRAIDSIMNTNIEVMSVAARSDIEARFSPDVHLASLLKIYRSIDVSSD